MAQLQSTGVTGSLTVTGQITAQTLSVQQVTSSILVVTGSNKFGSVPSNTQEFTGSLVVTGSGPHYIIGGNLGIGTASPGSKLQISPSQYTSLSSTDGISIWNPSSTSANLILGINGSVANIIQSRDGGSTAYPLTLNPFGGNVGIGTTSTGAKLEVAGTIVSGIYNNTRGQITTNGVFSEFYSTEANPRWSISRDLIAGGQAGIGFNDTSGTIAAAGSAIGGSILRTLAFYTSNGTSLVERVRIDSNGNLGIGTTTPVNRLHVIQDGATAGISVSGGTNPQLRATDGTRIAKLQALSDRGIVGTESNNDFAIFANNSEAIRITTIGDVGIGTTSPSTFGGGGLTLGSTTTGKNLIINSSNAGNNGLIQFIDTAGNSALQIAGTTTQTFLYSYGTRSMGLYTNNVERVSIASDGNVGIGTTSPDAKLRVAGTINATHSIFGNTDGRGLAIQTVLVAGTNEAGSILNARGVGSGTLIMQTDGTERVRIASDGNVGIGTTSPSSRLHVINADSGADGLEYQRWSYTAGSVPNYSLILKQTVTANVVRYNFSMINNSTAYNNVLVLDRGNVGIGVTDPTGKLQIDSNDTPTLSGTSPTGAIVIKSTASTALTFGVYNSSPFYGWLQMRHGTLADLAYPLSIQPLGGNVGVGVTNPTTKLHVDGTVSGSAFQLGPLQYAARRYSSTVANITTGSYTTLFNVYGDALSSAVRVVIRGTANSVVVDNIIDITANHSEDIVIKSQSGIYTILTIKVLAAGTNTEDFTVQAKINYHIDGQPLTANVDVYPYGNEIIEFNPGSIYSVTVLEHECSAGFNHSATGGTNYFNVNNGNVGIGTTTPAVKLEAQGNGVRLRLSTTSAPTTYYFDIESNYDSTNSVNFYGTGGNNFLKYVYNNNQLLLQPSAGNVGIGTTTAGAKLDVNGRIRLGSNSYTEIYSSGNRVLFRSDDVDNVGQFASYGLFLPQTGQSYNLYLAGGMQLGYTDSSPIISMARGSSGAVTYVQIASNGSSYFNGGSVGIGTTSPTSTLHVVGNARVGAVTGTTANHTIDLTAGGSGGNAYIDFGYYGTFDAAIWLAGYWGDASGTFKIKDASSGTPADRFVITQGSSPSITFPAGSVGIGTTSPGFILDVGGRMRIRNGGGTAGTWYNNAANNATVFFTGLISDTAWGVWDGSEWIAEFNTSNNFISKGDVIAYGSPSDIRLKDIKSTVSNALDSVLKLNGYKFDWKPSDSILQIKEDIGVIAQEVEEVFPELVRENESTGMKSVRYQGLIPVLIEAVKEQQKQIDELKYLLKNKQNGN